MNGRGRASLAAAICMIAVGFAPILYILWVLVSADPRQLNRGFFALFAGLSLFGEATLACLVGVAWAWSASRSRQGWGRVGLRLLAAALVVLAYPATASIWALVDGNWSDLLPGNVFWEVVPTELAFALGVAGAWWLSVLRSQRKSS